MPSIFYRFGLKDSLINQSDAMVSGSYRCHLFTNDPTATVDDVIADYTLASWPGYAFQLLTGHQAADWDDVNNVYTVTFDGVVFTGTGGTPVNVYGYLLTSPENLLVSGEIFDTGPITGGTPDAPIVIIPTLKSSN